MDKNDAVKCFTVFFLRKKIWFCSVAKLTVELRLMHKNQIELFRGVRNNRMAQYLMCSINETRASMRFPFIWMHFLWSHLNFRWILTINCTIILTEIDNWTLQTLSKNNENKQTALKMFEIKNTTFAGNFSTTFFYDLFKNSSKTMKFVFKYDFLLEIFECYAIECVEKVHHFGKAICERSLHCW